MGEDSSQPAEAYTYFYGNEKAKHQLEAGFFVQKESDQHLRGQSF
jgi:hypothetical protein